MNKCARYCLGRTYPDERGIPVASMDDLITLFRSETPTAARSAYVAAHYYRETDINASTL